MSEPVRIVITLEGGMISSICTLGVPVEALLIDYDTEDADPSEVEKIEQSNGTFEDAYVVHAVAEPLGIPIESLEELWAEKRQDPA